MSPKELLLKEIEQKLEKHRKWSSRDFSTFQILLWFSILASSISAILAAVDANKWLTMALAAIPALAITIENTFHFSERYKYHDQWITELEEMRRKVNVEEVPSKKVSTELSIFQKGMESKFPASSFPCKEKEQGKADSETGPSLSQ